MPYLSDTNILLRWVRPADPQHAVAVEAVEALLDRGEQVYVTPQNFIEFWSVATRPAHLNGLGLTPSQAEAEIARIEGLFLLAPDDPAIFDEWRRLVVAHGVSGAQVHDARLVAVMRVHGLTHILTFNPGDFNRFTGITVVRPQDIVSGS